MSGKGKNAQIGIRYFTISSKASERGSPGDVIWRPKGLHLRPGSGEKYCKIDQFNIIKHDTLGPKLYKTKIIRYENLGK